MTSSGYRCARCGEWHDELPFAFHVPKPAAWLPEHEADEESWLEEELCVVEGAHFFIRGIVRIPVVDGDDDFEWGVWTSLSRHNFARTLEIWDRRGREAEPPMFGWLSVNLPAYGLSTLSLPTMVHTQPLGLRPLVVLEPSDHPLSVEQREGITVARVQAIAEQILHAA
jgi:hypothetical protein